MIQPFSDDPGQGLRQTPYTSDNYLTLNEPGSESLDMFSFKGGAAGRLTGKAQPDPGGIITNAIIGRSNDDGNGSLFIRAQVAPRFWALPYFQPVAPQAA